MNPVLKVLCGTLGVTALLVGVMMVERAASRGSFMVQIFRHLTLYQDFYAFLPYVAILLAALLPQVKEIGVRVAAWCGEQPARLAMLTSAVLAAGAIYIFRAYPLTMDEYTVVFQSEIFAAGRLTGQFPPDLLDWLIPKGVQGKFLKPASLTGEVAAVYWPGFSLLLTPFTLLGVPWLLNPLIGGATVLVMYRIGFALFGTKESAGYVALLTVASPAVTISAMTYYSMPAHLLANALYLLLLLKPTAKRALLAGVVGSFALVLHSPVPHMFFALPWFVWLAFQPGGRKLVGSLAAGYLPICLLVGFGWAMFLDQLKLVTQYGEVAAPAGLAEMVLSRLRAALNWFYEPGLVLHVLNFAKLWLWAVPALLVVAALGAWHLRRDRGLWVAIAASGLVSYVAYLYVPFNQGHGWGYRYFHQAWLVLPLFAVAALHYRPLPALSAYLAGCSVLSLMLLTTFHAMQAKAFIAHHFNQLPAIPAPVRVVIIEPWTGYYAWDLAQNDPFLRNRVIVLTSRGEPADRAMMAKLFPNYVLLFVNSQVMFWGERQ
jgi:hypothetical protein